MKKAEPRLPPPPVAATPTAECKYQSLHSQVDVLLNAMSLLEGIEKGEELTVPPTRQTAARAVLERQVHDAAENLRNWSAQE